MIVTALLLGLLGSFHCLGMCGPIAFMLPVHKFSLAGKILKVSSYHLGRLISYALIGLLFGLLGKGINLFGMQQKLSVAMGLLMITLVLLPLTKAKVPGVQKLFFQPLGKLKAALGKELTKSGEGTYLGLGLLNGFLPCGLVYLAVIGAIASGEALEGSFYMLMFGMGTVPMMTLAVFASHRINSALRLKLSKAIPIFVILLGLLFVIRGLGLGIPYLSPQPVVELVEASIECH